MKAEAEKVVNEKGREWETIVFFWGVIKSHKPTLIKALIFYPLATLSFGTLMPFYVGKLLAALSVSPQAARHFLPYIVGVGLFALVSNRIGIANMFENQARVMAHLQRICLDTLLKQSASFHNDRVAGKLVSDAIEFPQAYSLLSSALIINMLPLIFTLALGVVLVSMRSLLLGLVLFGMASSVLGIAFLQSRLRRPLRQRRLIAGKAVTAHLADTIVNNQTVKTFAQEEYELKEHQRLNDQLLKFRIHDWRGGANAGNNRMIGLFAFQVLFAFTIIHVVQRDPSALAIGIFAFSYSVTLANNLFSINGFIRNAEDGFLQAEPMLDVLKQTAAIQDAPGASPLRVTKGAIQLNNVDFSYKESEAQESVFRKLNLKIKGGEKVGLVGPSGGGKSTLTRLLLRFNDIQSGEIAIDGQNIAEITQDSLRRSVAYVPQEPLMFHRSVFENIAYSNPNAAKEDVIRAAKQANAHDFIMHLSNGYDTLVGERGVKLSGGQRQRVAIARAILKDAPILILDEATSALDSESEVLIQDALQKLMQDKTAIVIAHRLSTIQRMDRIIVMADGVITEEGTHKALLKQKGLYAQLWAHQSGGFLED